MKHEFVYSRNNDRYPPLHSFESENGVIDFYYSQKNHWWDIEWIFSRQKGTGRALVREAAQFVGPGQLFFATVTHADSVDYLIKAGYYAAVTSRGENQSLLPSEYPLIPFTRMLQYGGLEIVHGYLEFLDQPLWHGYPVGLRTLAQT